MSINELFATTEKNLNSHRELSGSAALTKVASDAATALIKKMEENIDEYRDRIATSAKDNAEMDKLLEELAPYLDIEEDSPLRNFDEELVESLLKSQQSKRSRLKSKAMTLENYRSLMTASIVENFLRETYNKPKYTSGGFRKGAALTDLTPAMIEELADYPDRLRKEIRNIQSRKSIMKSKVGFDPNSEAWQQLLKMERMLKDIRDQGSTTYVEVDHTQDALKDLLDGIDVEHLKAGDSKELIARISELIK